MFITDPSSRPCRAVRNRWSMRFLVSLILLSATGCSYLCECESNEDPEQSPVVSSSETIYLDDSDDDASNSAPDNSTSSNSVSTKNGASTNSGTPTSTSLAAPTPIAGIYPLDGGGEQPTNTQAQTTPATANGTTPSGSPEQLICPEPMSNHYKKTVAFVSFPRTVATTSNPGALYKVEQQLPLLIGSNLTNRHAVLAPIYLPESFISTNIRGEADAAVQVQILSQRHRVQFFVSGEVDDLTMEFPNSVESPSYYTRFMSGTHNLLHINTPLDKRNRAFGFKVEVRDGFTGQVVYSNQYRTIGKWKPAPQADVGFGTSRFWKSDYGEQIQHLVAKASNDLAAAINCQPYVARVESLPGQQQVVVQSGSNSGLHLGDVLPIYQLVHQPISGEYQRFDTRLVKRTGYIHLTETYPSHSVGKVMDETLLGGQYLIKAR